MIRGGGEGANEYSLGTSDWLKRHLWWPARDNRTPYFSLHFKNENSPVSLKKRGYTFFIYFLKVSLRVDYCLFPLKRFQQFTKGKCSKGSPFIFLISYHPNLGVCNILIVCNQNYGWKSLVHWVQIWYLERKPKTRPFQIGNYF